MKFRGGGGKGVAHAKGGDKTLIGLGAEGEPLFERRTRCITEVDGLPHLIHFPADVKVLAVTLVLSSWPSPSLNEARQENGNKAHSGGGCQHGGKEERRDKRESTKLLLWNDRLHGPETLEDHGF